MSTKTIRDIQSLKGKEPIAMLTAYDFHTASMLDQAGIDILLVGDSVGSTIYGHDTTLPVTMDIMLNHTEAVVRGTQNALVVGDMPFGSYQPSVEVAVRNAVRFLSQAGAHAVKLEGGVPEVETIKRLVDVGIPVMAHVGLTPQSVHQMSGYRTRGKEAAEAERIHEDARAVAKAGAFAIVLECIPAKLAAEITGSIPIPTIGIGSGPDCDGQVLVTNDLLGYTVGHVPKFVKPVANLRSIVGESIKTFIDQTKKRS